jgi:hypothetical protein
MFFRIKPSGGRRYLQIVENKRVDGKVRQVVRLTIGRMGLLDAASGTSAVPESGVTTTAGSNPATLGPVSWFGWSAVSSSRPDRARGVVHSRGQEWPQAIA